MTWYHAGILPDSADTLGGVVLPVQVRWIDQTQHVSYLETRRLSVNGASDYLVAPLIAGIPITLELIRPYTWLYQVKLDALNLLLATPGQVMTLLWQSINYQVKFRQHDPPALDFTPVESLSDGKPILETGLYEGQIKLITV